MNDKSNRALLRFFPCLTDLAFLFPIAGLFVFGQGAKTLLADGDTGWHIRTGDWILQNGKVPHKDLFSFTKPGGEWFAWEWGWDVVFSLIHGRWGLSGVVIANILILGFIGVLLYRLVRRHAPNDAIAVLLTAVALCGSSLHWLARPHLLSWIFILGFLHLIDRAEDDREKLLWWAPVLMLLWVNLHGSFFIGIFFLVTYAAVNMLRDLLTGRSRLDALAGRRVYVLCSLVCLAVSLLNPYGWRLHEHVVRYLFDAKQLDGISEFASLSFHSPLGLRFELFLVLGLCAAVQAVKSGKWAEAAMILIWAHFALKSARNIPIFLFVATPASARLVGTGLLALKQSATAAWIRKLAGNMRELGEEFGAFERVERIPLVPITAMAFLVSTFGLLSSGSSRISDFDKKDFPVQAAEVLSAYPQARVFTFDQWGDYLIYRRFPKERVFVDGRSDFYGADFSDKWTNAIRARYDWSTELRAFAIDTVLIKPEDPLASVLKQVREWKAIFDNGNAIVFRRRT